MTGVLGAGYTGSYIFSQTLFAMRAGVATRLHSWIIAAMELGMFALPFSVRTLLPALDVQSNCEAHCASLHGLPALRRLSLCGCVGIASPQKSSAKS